MYADRFYDKDVARRANVDGGELGRVGNLARNLCRRPRHFGKPSRRSQD